MAAPAARLAAAKEEARGARETDADGPELQPARRRRRKAERGRRRGRQTAPGLGVDGLTAERCLQGGL